MTKYEDKLKEMEANLARMQTEGVPLDEVVALRNKNLTLFAECRAFIESVRRPPEPPR